MKALALRAGALRCAVSPEAGGALAGLWLGEVPVLRPAPADLQSARQSGLFALVPFSNRVADAKLAWRGEVFSLEPNFAPEPHAMHGVGWQRPWRVAQADESRATLVLSHGADAAWPFAFECRHRLALTPAGLDLTLEFTNLDTRVAPAGLGWHPYLVKRPGAEVVFEASTRWRMDARGLPTSLEPVAGLQAPCDGLDVNHVYEGFAGQAMLRDAVLDVTLRSALGRLVASTHPGKDFIALEPVTHATDAFNHGARGTVALAPGECFSARMAIDVRRVHRSTG